MLTRPLGSGARARFMLLAGAAQPLGKPLSLGVALGLQSCAPCSASATLRVFGCSGCFFRQADLGDPIFLRPALSLSLKACLFCGVSLRDAALLLRFSQ